MASAVSICNQALLMVGDVVIASFDDTTKEATLCSLAYDQCRQQELSSHPWQFATKRDGPLAALTTAPGYGFDYAFQLPTDYLRLVAIDNGVSNFVIEGQQIFSNDSEIYLRYVYDVDDVSIFPTWFQQLLAASIAKSIAFALAPSADLIKATYQQYQLAASAAMRMDNLSRDWGKKPPNPLDIFHKNESWRNARNR